MITVEQIAEEIIEEIGDSELLETAVSFWIRANTGKLNNLIATKIEIGSDNEFSPEIDDDIKDIIKVMYLEYYYKKKSTSVLNNAMTESILSIKDDVSSVQFINKSELAKTWKDAARSYKEDLNKLSDLYKRNRALPRSVMIQTFYHRNRCI